MSTAPSPSPPTPSISSGHPSPAPPPASTDPSNAPVSTADLKRLQRAQKKTEQEARKAERKRIAEETGVDPALLPASLAGEFGVKPGTETKGFLPREWIEVPHQGEGGNGGKKIKILSWNMLAQALVRRELFPGSDCLKGKDRLPALMQQVTYYSPDIACLQEVDRLSDHLPSLTLTHDYTSFIGYPNKKHGILIAAKRSVFNKVGEKGIRLDDLPLLETDDGEFSTAPTRVGTPVDASTPPPERNGDAEEAPPPTDSAAEDERPPDAPSSTTRASRRAAGLSRVTRNVGLFVALAFKDQPGGVIVGSTHLFWSGDFVYERTRQTAILMREIRKFQQSNEEWKDWPIFLAGDLNTQPNELTYRLSVSPSSPLPANLLTNFERSRVVHHTVSKLHDPSFEPPAPPEAEPQEGDTPAAEPGFDDPTAPRLTPIRNSRPGNFEDDGIADLDTLRSLFTSVAGEGGSGTRSAYGEAYGLCEGEARRWYCDRKPEVQAGNGWRVEETEEEKAKRRVGEWEERVKRGDFEPKFSNFTPLWRCTLDYIFLLPPSATSSAPRPPQWRSLLKMHDFSETCEPGLPRKGVEPSDHVAIGAVVEIF